MGLRLLYVGLFHRRRKHTIVCGDDHSRWLGLPRGHGQLLSKHWSVALALNRGHEFAFVHRKILRKVLEDASLTQGRVHGIIDPDLLLPFRSAKGTTCVVGGLPLVGRVGGNID